MGNYGLTMCITLPPPPVIATPDPNPPAPAPTPPTISPGPAPVSSTPPNVNTPTFLLSLDESTILDTNNITHTFNDALSAGGISSTVASGSGGSFHANLVIYNQTASTQPVTITVVPAYTEMSVSPIRVQTLNLPGSSSATVTFILTVVNGGGTYNVTFGVGTNTVTIPLAVTFLDP